jgi:hypothetical protein
VNKRRDFFKQFIGQIGVLRDDIRGVDNIPLNRLKELPDSIIRDIEPVFFPEEQWHLKDRVIHIPESQHSGSIQISLNEIEYKALGKFKNRIKLKQTALEISMDSEIPFEEVYKIITTLFFKLASLRICHPREIYHIDDILSSKK